MLCKKCGASIEDNSKFCGYCGEVVTGVNQSLNTVQSEAASNNQFMIEDLANQQQENIFENVSNTTQNTTLEQPNIQNVIPNIESNVQPVNSEVNVIQSTSEDSINTTQNPNPVQSAVSNEVTNVVDNMQPINNENNSNKETKKNNKKMFIIIGIVLGIVTIVLLCFSFLNGSGSSISVLKKAIANLELNTKSSFTVNANLITSDNNKELSFDAIIKSQKKAEDEINMQILVNKTELFDEINSYLIIKNNNAEMYLQSTLVDLLGLTSSLEPIWIYNSIDLEELEIKENNDEKIDLEQIIDEEHFVLIDKVNGQKHYQLIIDQKLIDSIKTKFEDTENETIKSIIENNETIEEPIKIDFYISKSNEFVKVDINLLDYLGEDIEMSKMLLSIKFSNFNNTVVNIPNEVKNGIYDLETYMATHAVQFNFNSGFDF